PGSSVFWRESSAKILSVLCVDLFSLLLAISKLREGRHLHRTELLEADSSCLASLARRNDKALSVGTGSQNPHPFGFAQAGSLATREKGCLLTYSVRNPSDERKVK